MKKSILKLIEKSLRFHHQDIHKELDEIKLHLDSIMGKLESLSVETDNKEALKQVIKHELNNTSFKWNNEYKFVPAGQNDDSLLSYEGTTEGQ